MAAPTDFDARYELRRVTPTLDADGQPSAESLGFMDAMQLGFHEGAPDPARLATTLGRMQTDDVQFLGAYLRSPMPGSMDAVAPVGTFGWMRKPLSWGDGREIDTFAILGVTVRATERRRGLLRRMMTDALTSAVAEGYPLASLTASEGTIYRRFGFGPAIRERAIEVQRARAVPLLGEVTGEVVVVPPSYLADGVGRAVFDRFHARTLGSMVRNTGSWPRLFGVEDRKGEVERSIRAAVHRDDDGEVDGYVTYRLVEESSDSARIEIVDLVYATDAAYLALWDYLLAIDLNKSIRYEQARIDDPILHAINDNRAYDVDHEEDHVWLRVLDPVRVLESRPWAHDGTLTIRLRDALGFAAGLFRLEVSAGRASVTPLPEADGAELTMDVSTLGAMLLGTVDPVVLAGIGLVEEGHPAAPALLRAMLVPARTPHGITYF